MTNGKAACADGRSASIGWSRRLFTSRGNGFFRQHEGCWLGAKGALRCLNGDHKSELPEGLMIIENPTR